MVPGHEMKPKYLKIYAWELLEGKIKLSLSFANLQKVNGKVKVSGRSQKFISYHNI